MPLETATYISDLAPANPAASDPMANADDHLRLIKQVTKATLAHTGQLTNTDNQLIPAAGTSAKPAYSFAAEPTLGIYRSAAGIMTVTGGKIRGVRDAGEVTHFLKEPASLGKTITDTGKEWLELNGATYNVSDYPALATFLGASGSTFTLPDAYTTGRFLRSRTAAVAALTTQANTVGPHTHPDVTATTSAASNDHTHTYAGTTGNDSPDHTHTYQSPVANATATGATNGFTLSANGGTATASSGASTRHTHAFSGVTSGISANHVHSVTVSTPANTGTTETRPEALAVVFVVKT